MIPAIETILLYASVLMLLSVLASKLSARLSIPALLVFLVIGMLAGPEGPGKIYFNDPWLAKSIGIIALIFIIFSGGIDTHWKGVRQVLLPGFILSTLGVLITAVIVGLFAVLVLKFSFIEGMLLGSIVSSTDAAAVFSILRSRRVRLKGNLAPLLELESGSNDPMAVFLTLGFVGILASRGATITGLLPKFILDMGVGALMGYVSARLGMYAINRIKLEYSGLYPVLTTSLVLLTYAVTTLLKGNGILAVYLTGLIMSSHEFMHKKVIAKFHDGLAWLMQITMFLSLGLLVFPSHIVPVIGGGLLLAAALMFLARPVSMFVCLLPFGFNPAEKAMVSWVGLRGAVPIILATFPLLAGMAQAETIFNVVFFVVITSIMIQGASLPFVARLLRVDAPLPDTRYYPIEFEKREGIDAELTDTIVPYNSEAVGKRIGDLNVPPECLIVLISRGDKFVIPSGATVIEGGDVFLVLANETDLAFLRQSLSRLHKAE